MSGQRVSIVIVNKDEPALAETLNGIAELCTEDSPEIVVVDASQGRMDALSQRLPGIVWVPFVSDSGKAITIAEQRNLGVKVSTGEVVVFIDSGCRPQRDWLDSLVSPILNGSQSVTVGQTRGSGSGNVYAGLTGEPRVLDEAPTINLAFTRVAFDSVGGFDEGFDYGSDIDFTWRLRAAGHRLWFVPQARITHDWGGPSRQLVRAFRYGAARARGCTASTRRGYRPVYGATPSCSYIPRS